MPSEHDDDIRLLARAGAGDRDAFSLFFDRHAPRALGLLLKLLRSRPDADDVLQDVFCAVWTRAAEYNAERGSPIAWLLLIARSRAIDYLRRRRRDTNPGAAVERVAADDAASLIDRDETSRGARRALADLPPEQRSVIELAFYGGLTHEQIALQRSLPLGTVKTRIRLGMKRLRETLTGEVSSQ
ncbi:ECF RNA polymerase sigma factor RpoE [Phycisphaerae bacterium RAS1]|nr:ECF RNA polymerase sigma factor RpoE [Phycisphaerae bacterium RAS1]